MLTSRFELPEGKASFEPPPSGANVRHSPTGEGPMTITVSAHRAPATARTHAASPFQPAYGIAPKKDLDAIAAFLGKHWNVKSVATATASIEAQVKKSGLEVGRFREL